MLEFDRENIKFTSMSYTVVEISKDVNNYNLPDIKRLLKSLGECVDMWYKGAKYTFCQRVYCRFDSPME